MSSINIKLIDERAALQSNPRCLWNVARALTKFVLRYLIEDSQSHSYNASADIRSCLEPVTGDMDLHGAYAVLKLWYRHMSIRAPRPSWDYMAKFTKDYGTLYFQEDPDPPGQMLVTHVDFFQT